MNFRPAIVFPFVFLLIFGVSGTDAMFVNEFMPAPSDACSQCSEWIEVTSDQNESLENVTIDTGESMRTRLNGTIFCGQFIIITKNISVFSDIWNTKDVTIFENSKMRLTDNGDNITIYNGSHELQRVEYSNATKNVSYGLCENIIVKQNISTPGSPNTCSSGEFNGTANQTNNTCDLNLWISCKEIFVSDESNSYRLVAEDLERGNFEPEVEYWIEDMFGNIVRSKERTKNTNPPRYWTPPEIRGGEAYIIRAMIINETCNDSNLSNNYAEKIIIVKGSEPISNSSVKILDVDLGSDGKAKFGDVVEVKINIYKGDTNKNAVEIWLENNGGKKAGKTDFNLYSKFSNYTLSVPIQINSNCGGDLQDGTYFVKIEGLDMRDEKEILIEGISSLLCKTKTIEIQKPCSCSPCQSCNISNKTGSLLPKDFEIISCPEEIAKNMELLTKLLINATGPRNYTAYSYVYDGNKPLSLGFDGKKWLNTWSANKQEISTSNSTIITLRNRISNDTEPGKYKLRVKIIYDGKEHEITRDIVVTEEEILASQKNGSKEIENNNETVTRENNQTGNISLKENETVKQIKIPTGGVVSKKEDNWFSVAINNLINFFKNLFKL